MRRSLGGLTASIDYGRWMALFENPVLNRELLVNLRTNKSFFLLAAYQIILAGVVYFSWPDVKNTVELSVRNQKNAALIDVLFLSQFVLTSLIAPSFAAGGIAGEKERRTYEMLLASPVRPQTIVFGKLVASLTHLAILVFSSLPIVMLCLPMGGVSIYEVLVQMLVVLASMTTFCMISLTCSSYFTRTAASLSISYLFILILAALTLWVWNGLRLDGQSRLNFMLLGIPSFAIVISVPLFHLVAARMMFPPDVGSEGAQVVDLEKETMDAVGLVLNRDAFPDRLLLPPTRLDLMPDNANPVYDKEMRSEFIGQGTLMLRWVIQISMIMAIGLMAGCVIIWTQYIGYYICYMVVFNVLVGPVFSAGIVTSERERQTLDLLLTTPLSGGQIWMGKMLASLRVSSVLTSFLLWPLVCGIFLRLFPDYITSPWTLFGYAVIIGLTCWTTCTVGLFFSTVYSKTSVSIIVSYACLLLLYAVIPGIAVPLSESAGPDSKWMLTAFASLSPFFATFRLPLHVSDGGYSPNSPQFYFAIYAGGTIILNVLLSMGAIRNLLARERLLESSSG